MTAPSTGPMLLCGVAGRFCAVPIEHVVETMRPLPIEAVAGAPDFVLGVAIVRGAALPVVDAARLVGSNTASATPSGRFVTLRVDARHVVLAVESVAGVRRLPATSIAELPPLLRDATVDLVETLGALDARLLVVLRAMHLVTESLPSMPEERGEE